MDGREDFVKLHRDCWPFSSFSGQCRMRVVWMFQQWISAAAAGTILRLVVAIMIGDRSESRGSTAVASCRHQLVFDVYDGYECDVIVEGRRQCCGGRYGE